MIVTRHQRWADYIFRNYLNRLLRKNFSSVHLLGDIPEINPALPLLLLPNHSTWWDGFFVYFLNKKLLHRKLYLMMLERQLKRFTFFSKVGAYSINPGSITGVKQSLRYTTEILNKEKNVMICLFAQGVLSPWFKRPLEFQRGFETLLIMYGKKINILPLGIKAVYLAEQHAQVFFRFDTCDVLDSKNFTGIAHYEKRCEKILDQIVTAINNGETGTILFTGAKSLSR